MDFFNTHAWLRQQSKPYSIKPTINKYITSGLPVTRERSHEAQEAKGNLYGTIFTGGDTNCERAYGCGTVWQITKWLGWQWRGMGKSQLRRRVGQHEATMDVGADEIRDCAVPRVSRRSRRGAASTTYRDGCSLSATVAPFAAGCCRSFRSFACLIIWGWRPHSICFSAGAP